MHPPERGLEQTWLAGPHGITTSDGISRLSQRWRRLWSITTGVSMLRVVPPPTGMRGTLHALLGCPLNCSRGGSCEGAGAAIEGLRGPIMSRRQSSGHLLTEKGRLCWGSQETMWGCLGPRQCCDQLGNKELMDTPTLSLQGPEKIGMASFHQFTLE